MGAFLIGKPEIICAKQTVVLPTNSQLQKTS